MKSIISLIVFAGLLTLTGCYTQLALDGYGGEKREKQVSDEYAYDDALATEDTSEYYEDTTDYYDDSESSYVEDDYYIGYRPMYRRYYWGYNPGLIIHFGSTPWFYYDYWDLPAWNYYWWDLYSWGCFPPAGIYYPYWYGGYYGDYYWYAGSHYYGGLYDLSGTKYRTNYFTKVRNTGGGRGYLSDLRNTGGDRDPLGRTSVTRSGSDSRSGSSGTDLGKTGVPTVTSRSSGTDRGTVIRENPLTGRTSGNSPTRIEGDKSKTDKNADVESGTKITKPNRSSGRSTPTTLKGTNPPVRKNSPTGRSNSSYRGNSSSGSKNYSMPKNNGSSSSGSYKSGSSGNSGKSYSSGRSSSGGTRSSSGSSSRGSSSSNGSSGRRR